MKVIHIPSQYKLILIVTCAVFLVSITSCRRSRKGSLDVEDHYTKHEFRIPMRDGVKLFTAVYTPKDTSKTFPFFITRTPYSVLPYGANKYPSRLGPSDSFDRAGYIFVFQDVRGRYQSEGQFVDTRPHIDHPKNGETDESTDTYDTIEWLLKNVPGNNGKVGIWGISYPGFYTSASIIDSDPAIKAASPEAPVTNLFKGDDAYHNGAFMLDAQFEFYSTFFRLRPDGPDFPPANWNMFDYGTNDGYRFFLQHGPDLTDIAKTINNSLFDNTIAHDTYDRYWETHDISQHLKNIRCAVLNVGGWFDAEDLAGTLRTYAAIEKDNPDILNILVMGPWGHGDWARLPDNSPKHVELNAAQFYREHIAFPFFEHFLKDQGNVHLPEAEVFETGTNVWRQYAAWPPKERQQKTIYLHEGGKVSFDPPAQNEKPFDEYVSDPAHPVPYVPYPSTNLESEYMFADQRFLAKRADVLNYVSDPLQEDVTLVGPVSPHLQVSTSSTDSDFDVKLIDVYPGNSAYSVPRNPSDEGIPADDENAKGYEELIRGEPMRGKFRNSFSSPQAMIPNAVTAVDFEMPDVSHTFRRGHRIMVQIQSSWFPLTDLNPQTFIDTRAAKASDFVKATERIYHTPAAESGIVVGVLQH
jgi:putative CocE/NonD family hydrolase